MKIIDEVLEKKEKNKILYNETEIDTIITDLTYEEVELPRIYRYVSYPYLDNYKTLDIYGDIGSKIGKLHCSNKKKDIENIRKENERIIDRIHILNSYVLYKKYMQKNGASLNVFDMPIIKEIIITIIEKGTREYNRDFKSVLALETIHKDGSFDIAARINDMKIDEKYTISRCNDDDPEHYISIRDSSPNNNESLIDGSEEIAYINKFGEIVEQGKVLIK